MTDIERLSIERACEQLQYAYARYIDFRDYEGFAEVFALDGVLSAGIELKGREAIFLSCQARAPDLRSRHVITNCFIDVEDASNARGICYVSLFQTTTKGLASHQPARMPGPALIGHYQDRFVLTPEGWKFRHRTLHVAFQEDTRF